MTTAEKYLKRAEQLSAVGAAMKHRAAAAAELQSATKALGAAIRQALDAGVTATDLVALTNLSRARIYQIRAGSDE